MSIYTPQNMDVKFRTIVVETIDSIEKLCYTSARFLECLSVYKKVRENDQSRHFVARRIHLTFDPYNQDYGKVIYII